MIKNYFKIALRNLAKSKLHTGINLIGLSLGLGVSILIFFFVQFERNFDVFHDKGERIFRLKRVQKNEAGEEFGSFSTPVITAQTFKESFPQVELVSGMFESSVQTYLDESTTQSQELFIVSPDFLEIFDFPLIVGEKGSVLQDKFSAVITQEIAKKYFGDANPVGKTMRMKTGANFEEYQITGLLADLPANSSIGFEVLINTDNLDFIIDKESQNSWYNVYGETFVLLNDPAAKPTVDDGSHAMMKKVLGEDYEEGRYYFELQPIAEMHLNTDTNGSQVATTRPSLLWILAGIAVLILLIACINFTTMAIGRSATRAREVGVRKTMGADFRQLVQQFMTEAFLTTLIALVFGVCLAELLLPIFNKLFEKSLDLYYGPSQLLILAALVFGITAMAGVYPAFFLSSLRPIKVLKGNLSMSFGKQTLRKGLVGFQFFISFCLISATLIMVNQMNAIRDYDLGFDRDMVVIVDVPDVPGTDLGRSMIDGFASAEKYRQALAARTEVQSAGLTISTYGDNAFWNAGFPNETNEEQFSFRLNFVGGDYVKTMGLKVVDGRDFDPMPGSDSSAFLINETFAKVMKWDDPTGELLPNARFKPHQIVGVVKDFNHNSLYQEIEPVLLAKSPASLFGGLNTIMISSSVNPKVVVKGTGSDFNAFKAVLENEWKSVFPGNAFSFQFMDETVEEQYRADERLGKLVFIAAGIAILIATMGLFAMAALSIAGRTKEIGIRKVLGASVWSISWMFNKEYLVITLAGVIVALPLSIYLMGSWIEQFAVRDWPSWVYFLGLAAVGIGFTLLIVSGQALRATQMNPVDTLKTE